MALDLPTRPWTQWPTPWKHETRHGFDYGDIRDANGVTILSGAVNHQLRDRLLTSVNAHADLVEACRASLTLHHRICYEATATVYVCHECGAHEGAAHAEDCEVAAVGATIRAALAKAGVPS